METCAATAFIDKLPAMILTIPMMVGNIPERKKAARCPINSVIRENLTNRISLATSVSPIFITDLCLTFFFSIAVLGSSSSSFCPRTSVAWSEEPSNFEKADHLHRLAQSCGICALVDLEFSATSHKVEIKIKTLGHRLSRSTRSSQSKQTSACRSPNGNLPCNMFQHNFHLRQFTIAKSRENQVLR